MGENRGQSGRSGPPPEAATSADEDMRAALEATTRSEASLSALMRAVEQVTSGVSGAQEANERLAAELGRVRELLGATNEQRLAFKNRIATLEESLRRSEEARQSDRERADEERTFLVQEQDRFLRALLEEHEEQLAALKRELAEARTNASSHAEKKTLPGVPLPANHPEQIDTAPQGPAMDKLRNQLDKLLAERDRSRELLRRIQTQRDEAQKQLSSVMRERDEDKTEIARLTALLDAPPDLSAALRAQDERALHPTPLPSQIGRRTDPQPQARISAPELPLVQPDGAAKKAPNLELEALGPRPPPTALLRRQDPKRRTPGAYSVSPFEPDAERADARPTAAKPRSR